MKLSKKLFAAVATLGLAFAATVGSTYAWFSMNSTVTASNMKVKVKAQKNLLITTTSGSYVGGPTTVDLSIDKDTLVPTSCDATQPNLNWYKVKNSTGINFSSGAKGDDTTFQMASATEGDYVKTTFYIKSVGEGAGNLRAAVSVMAGGGGTHIVDRAYRVLVVVNADGASRRVYAPIANHSTGYHTIKGVDVDDKPQMSTGTVTPDVAGNVILTELEADTEYQVDVYIWCEGQDDACTSLNAVSLTPTTFQIALTVE